MIHSAALAANGPVPVKTAPNRYRVSLRELRFVLFQQLGLEEVLGKKPYENWGREEVELALGAAIGTPARRSNSSATGCSGTRSPAVGSPAVTASGIAACFFTTIVSGPGQYRSASRCAASGHSAARARAASIDATCTISGLVAGRPFSS